MKHQTPESMKFRKLARRLNLRKYEAVGVLESLWMFARKFTNDGNIAAFSALEVAAWMEWPDDPDLLIDVLVATGWLIRDGSQLIVDDWTAVARDHRDVIGRRRDLSTADWRRMRQLVAEEDGTVCVYCGCDCGQKFTVDHVIPVARGGTMDRGNLVIACRKCNGRKGDR